MAACKPAHDAGGVSPKQSCFSHWGCCESLPAPSSGDVGVRSTLSEQAQGPGCCWLCSPSSAAPQPGVHGLIAGSGWDTGLSPCSPQ